MVVADAAVSPPSRRVFPSGTQASLPFFLFLSRYHISIQPPATTTGRHLHSIPSSSPRFESGMRSSARKKGALKRFLLAMGTPAPLLIACTGYLTLRTRHSSLLSCLLSPSLSRVEPHPGAPSSSRTFLFFAFSLPSSPSATPPDPTVARLPRLRLGTSERASPCIPFLSRPLPRAHLHQPPRAHTHARARAEGKCDKDK